MVVYLRREAACISNRPPGVQQLQKKDPRKYLQDSGYPFVQLAAGAARTAEPRALVYEYVSPGEQPVFGASAMERVVRGDIRNVSVGKQMRTRTQEPVDQKSLEVPVASSVTQRRSDAVQLQGAELIFDLTDRWLTEHSDLA